MLNKEEIKVAYQKYLLPQVGYTIPCVTITENKLDKLQLPITKALLHSLGINRKFPHVVAFFWTKTLWLVSGDTPLISGDAKD